VPPGRRDVLAGLTEFDATFPARDARAVALERSAGTPIDASLAQLKALRGTDEILVLADGTGTTRQHRGRERTVVAITQRLTAAEVTPLPAGAAEREADRVDDELAARGGRLSEQQRVATHLACGPRPLVLIEGQAGTGKSTALTGIARAHHTDGREILITSTAALAAERLASELGENGVDCKAYSTAGLTTAIRHDRVRLTPQTTIIHDEAALASTREQLDLLEAVETSGARLIAVGDPQQNQPVGAGLGPARTGRRGRPVAKVVARVGLALRIDTAVERRSPIDDRTRRPGRDDQRCEVETDGVADRRGPGVGRLHREAERIARRGPGDRRADQMIGAVARSELG
jgi:hypothetical protein